MIGLAILAPSLLFLAAPAQAEDGATVRRFNPSEADPAIRSFDDPNIVIAPPGLPDDAPLAVFMPGTAGKPEFGLTILKAIAAQGYRVIGLQYENVPAVVQLCTDDPDPDCASDFREMRLLGTGKSKTVSNSPAESIVGRLVSALRYLDRTAPAEHWGRYLKGNEPRWGEILLSGQSQGAGMAAWIAKRHAVRRVVLFSSPWDTTGRDNHPAPWLSERSATSPSRWQAAYNSRENTAALIQAGYAALRVPAANIHVFTLDLPDGAAKGGNPYHPIGIRDERYAPVWKIMFGRGSDRP
jgi:hypothetical protein